MTQFLNNGHQVAPFTTTNRFLSGVFCMKFSVRLLALGRFQFLLLDSFNHWYLSPSLCAPFVSTICDLFSSRSEIRYWQKNPKSTTFS